MEEPAHIPATAAWDSARIVSVVDEKPVSPNNVV
jgi:hypothetical protein